MVHKITTESSIPLTVDLIDTILKDNETAKVLFSSGTVDILPDRNIRILNNEYLQISSPKDNKILARLKLDEIIGVVRHGEYRV